MNQSWLSDAAKAVIFSAMDAIISIDQQQHIVLFNPAAEQMFGLSESVADGMPIDHLIPSRWRSAHAHHVEVFGKTGVSTRRMGALGKISGLRSNGEEFPIEASISQVEVGGEKIFTVILRDITERTKTEERLGRLAAIVESSEDAILSKNLEGIITSWNTGAEKLLGYQATEMIGQPIVVLIPSELREEESGILERLRRGECLQHYETVRVDKSGRRIDVSLTVSPIRDSAGTIIGASKIMHDISERKQMEAMLRAAKADLEKTVRERTAELRATIADLEGFSYSLSHDMRAPLRAIQSFAEIVLADYGKRIGMPGTEYLQKIRSAAQRLDRLIEDVLTLTRVSQQVIGLRTINVEKLLHAIIAERPELQCPRVEINVQGPLLPVMGQEASLTQCLTNLLSNAAKFVAHGVQPQVRIWSEPKGDQVRLWFEDNGIGIEQEAQKKLFQIFVRLNNAEEYEGMGIGLAIVCKAMGRMGGEAGVESEAGKGSRFWLQLSAANQ